MIGSGLAMVSCLAAIGSFFVEPTQVAFAMLLSALLALMAAWWRGRPVLLLAAFTFAAIAFIYQPPGLQTLMQTYQIETSLSEFAVRLIAVYATGLIIALLFAISCRRQSGGVRLSAQEASEDLEKMVRLFGQLSALIYVPLLLLPLYLFFSQSPLSQLPQLSVLAQEMDIGTVVSPDLQSIAWLVAVLMLGGMASSYMKNAHHRYVGVWNKWSDRARARLEFWGSVLLLLPFSFALNEQGWISVQKSVDQQASQSQITHLMAIGPAPNWWLYTIFPIVFLFLAAAAISIMLRSLIYLYGPTYLKKRAATHVGNAEQLFRPKFSSKSDFADQEGGR